MAPLPSFALALVLLSASLSAQASSSDPVGTWQGKLDVGVAKLRLVLHIAGEPGALSAKLDSPDQGAKGIGVDSVIYADGVLKFTIAELRASYEGVFDAKTTRFVGTFTQGQAFSLDLERFEGEVAGPKRPQHPRPPFPYDVEEVSYSHDPDADTASSFAVAAGDGQGRVQLAATLTLPRAEGPHPAVVLISGSGAQDRDESLLGHKPFLVLADALTRRGIAVLRFDDRGTGKSTGEHSTATSRDFAADARAGMLYLQGRKEIDDAKIGLVGHSEGGLIGPMVASVTDDVAFLVLLAGPGVDGARIILLQSRLIGKAMGATDEQLALGEKTTSAVFAAVREGGDATAVRERVERLLATSYDELPDEVRSEVGSQEQFVRQSSSRVLTPWFRFFLTYDPAPALAKVRCPVLAVNGALDLQVDPKQNLPAIEKALAGNDDVTAIEFEGLNHLFQHCTTGVISEYAEIEETFAPAVLRCIGDWIAERFL